MDGVTGSSQCKYRRKNTQRQIHNYNYLEVFIWSLANYPVDVIFMHRPDYPGKDKTLRRFEKFTLDHGGFQVKYNYHSIYI